MSVFAILCLVFLTGCFCGIKFELINILYIVSAVTFVFLLKIVVFKTKTYINLFVSGVLIVFICGTALGAYTDYKTFYKANSLCGNEITVSGTVTEVEGDTFMIDTEYGGIKAYNYINAEVKQGDVVKLKGYFSMFSTSQYTGDFDQRLYYALGGIVGYAECHEITVTGHTDKTSLSDLSGTLREKVRSAVNSTNTSGRSKGFVTALLTGETEGMDDKTKEAFNLTGTSHVTAVSGLHVGIFLSFFILFTKGFRRNKIIHTLFVIVLIVMYTVFIGERASVLRSGVMTIICYIVFAMRRRSDSLVNLVLAGVIICLVNPYYVTSAGFQMSFIATFGIVVFANSFKYQLISVPFIATLFMLPVILYYYGNFSVTTILVNVVVVFLLPVIILMGYLGCFIPYLMYVSLAMAEFVIIIVEFFASMTFLHFNLPAPGIRQFIMYFMVMWGAYYAFVKKMVRKTAMILLAVVVVYVNGIGTMSVSENSSTVRFINSGNFNMHHITTESGANIFVNCGTSAYDYALKSGVKDIYAVIITDGGKSRYAGLKKLCDTTNVEYVVLPMEFQENNFNLENCEVLYYNQSNYKFYVDNVNFRIRTDGGEKSMLIQIYDDLVAIPLDKTAADARNCTVLSLSDKCKDIDKASENNIAKYYVYPTYRYKNYNHENKYITSQVGMVSIVFRENAKPQILSP
ncbi:MAG: ComEC/Rec2 family competence protein [Clostridia bacterium]|nr:ComEC/Rec2 family competence protein [Clostridia bacterium]